MRVAEKRDTKRLSQKVWHGFATRAFHRLKTGATRVNGIGSKIELWETGIRVVVHFEFGAVAPKAATIRA